MYLWVQRYSFFLKMGKQNALDVDFILNFRPQYSISGIKSSKSLCYATAQMILLY